MTKEDLLWLQLFCLVRVGLAAVRWKRQVHNKQSCIFPDIFLYFLAQAMGAILIDCIRICQLPNLN